MWKRLEPQTHHTLVATLPMALRVQVTEREARCERVVSATHRRIVQNVGWPRPEPEYPEVPGPAPVLAAPRDQVDW